MKKLVLVLVLVFLVHLISATEITKDISGRPLYAADRIKVKLHEEAVIIVNETIAMERDFFNTGLDSFDTLNLLIGVSDIKLAHRPVKDKVWDQNIGFDRWYLIFVPEGTDIEQSIIQYKNNEYVESAIPEFRKYLSVTPNDTYFDECWGHDNTSSNGPGSGHVVGFDSHIEEAWDDEQSYGASGIIIAILDTGVDYNHEDLDDNCIAGYDYGDDDSDPMDDSADEGHGTCCAGVAAAEVNNSIGVSGVAGNCSIMPLKVSDSAGYLYSSYITNALIHCGDNNVDVASMSFGSYSQPGQDPTFDAALEYAYNNGVTLLAATGNGNGSSISNPANDVHVIAIGAASPCAERKDALSCDGQYWWGSDYGSNTQDARDAVDVVSPTILPATDVTGSDGYSTGQYYMEFGGTSCATPYAAGVAALILSKNPYLTIPQVRTALTTTATDVMDEEPSPGWDRYTGYGMINADAAVGSVAGSGFPLCEITNPTDGEVIDTGDIVTITVDASDPSRSVSNVKIYIDDILKTTDYSAPYEYVWDTSGETIDYHDIKATATDDELNETDDEITVRIAHPSYTIFEDGFETDLGWTLVSEFERGAPGGLGGEHGNADPTSAYEGSNVLGVDLTGLGTYSGDYETNLSDRAYTATSPSINCTGYTNVQLEFWRWLNVESPTYDHAYLDVYNGSSWVEIWTNSSLMEESSWGQQTYDVSTYADGNSNFRIRFCIGATDGSWQYSGWNIDDLVLSGEGGPSASITVTSPNGGEDWELDSTHNITWTSSNTSGDVKIELYDNGVFSNTISSSTSDDGSYSWFIDESVYSAGTQYTVKIEDVTDPATYDDSDADFTLSAIPEPDITYTPTSFEKDLLPDATTSDHLFIGNAGGATLDYTATVSYIERSELAYITNFVPLPEKQRKFDFIEKDPPIEYDPSDYPAPLRQGGEDVGSAVTISSLPFTDTGTTSGYLDDYDETCPYSGSTSPDVCYSYAPAADMSIDIDLCNSSYDTKVYVYENSVTPGSPFACDDDYYGSGDPCGSWVSALLDLSIYGGNTYYIIVDGYGGDSGDYEIEVTENITTGYCSASGGGDEYISGVQIGSIDNTGTGSDGYYDYTALSTDLTQEETGVAITITNGNVYSSDDLGIWIDWNQDEDFEDTDENVVCTVNDGAQGTYYFDVPADAVEGNTRMRIRIKYYGSDCGSSCGSTTYGEVEDYTINVLSSGPGYSWLTLDGGNEVSGTILSGGADDDITVGFDATGLSLGAYDANIVITSNDPDESTVNIPVTLNVTNELDPPANLVITSDGTDVTLAWDPVTGATSYTVYSDTDPYGIFATSEWTGADTNWSEPLAEDKKFYRVTASN